MWFLLSERFNESKCTKNNRKKHAVIVLCRLLWLYLQREYKQLIINKLQLNNNLRKQIECVTICVTIMEQNKIRGL